jgi:hypothetical protein
MNTPNHTTASGFVWTKVANDLVVPRKSRSQRKRERAIVAVLNPPGKRSAKAQSSRNRILHVKNWGVRNSSLQ